MQGCTVTCTCVRQRIRGEVTPNRRRENKSEQGSEENRSTLVHCISIYKIRDYGTMNMLLYQTQLLWSHLNITAVHRHRMAGYHISISYYLYYTSSAYIVLKLHTLSAHCFPILITKKFCGKLIYINVEENSSTSLIHGRNGCFVFQLTNYSSSSAASITQMRIQRL